MSIPKLNISETGIQAPSIQEITQGLWDMFQQAFGSDLNMAMNTPQGQLITSLAAVISDERNQMIMLLNQFDPRYAQGIWQDALGQVYFMQRKKGTRSTAQIKAIGLAGTRIPAGFQVMDGNGNYWETTSQNNIGSNGEVLVDVQHTQTGMVGAAPNTITDIPTALSGLDRVFNPYAAIMGTAEEGRYDFERRRRESVALNSKNTNASVLGTIANLTDVVDVCVIDNPSDLQKTYGSTQYSIKRNSILVSVVGGDSEQIARAILSKAGSGCSFNGNTDILIKDTDNYSERPPEYHVQFLRPQHVPIFFRVQLEDRLMMSYPDEQKIKETIIDSFSSGKTRGRIGKSIVASEFICHVANAVPHLRILSLRVGRDPEALTDFVNVGVDEYPTTTVFQISVT